MIKFEHADVYGFDHAIRGMRNPMNSWDKSDSDNECPMTYDNGGCDSCDICNVNFVIGPNDFDLMKRLYKAGTDHRKFLRMITVYVDITAPLYWWKEFDTYKVGTVANSCSTMHKLCEKEFELEDFSHEHLIDYHYYDVDGGLCPSSLDLLKCVVSLLNDFRDLYLENNDKDYWWQMIQLLPSSYNQKRTVMLNYEVLANIFKSRKNHKLDEWYDFCHWIETLPYSMLITGKENDK